MNSQRLVGKVMFDILGKPVIWHIYNRLSNCKLLNSVVISTGEYEKNKQICDFASENKIQFYSGSETDLINRLYQTSIYFRASAIVRITSDCPLVDPKIVDDLVLKYIDLQDKYDIVTNCQTHTFPHGLDIEVYSSIILKKMNKLIKQPELREWFPFFVAKNPELFRVLNVANDKNLSNIRLTLDYQEDYDCIKKIYQALYNEKKIFYMADIMKLLKKQPELLQINSKYIEHRNIDAPKL